MNNDKNNRKNINVLNIILLKTFWFLENKIYKKIKDGNTQNNVNNEFNYDTLDEPVSVTLVI
jgi:hypothetical protein